MATRHRTGRHRDTLGGTRSRLRRLEDVWVWCRCRVEDTVVTLSWSEETRGLGRSPECGGRTGGPKREERGSFDVTVFPPSLRPFHPEGNVESRRRESSRGRLGPGDVPFRDPHTVSASHPPRRSVLGPDVGLGLVSDILGPHTDCRGGRGYRSRRTGNSDPTACPWMEKEFDFEGVTEGPDSSTRGKDDW